MRLQDYWYLIQTYLPPVILTATAAGGLYLLGYFLFYKKLLHGKKKIDIGSVIPIVLLGIYLLFLFCITLLNRGGGAPTGINLTPFTSWRTAWYQVSASSWLYIIFNIIAFIPLGILLPLCSEWFDRWVKILLSGFGCSLLIEITQLITGRGLFETDDLIHNTLGTAIGYGFFCLFWMLFRPSKRKRVLRTLISQLPFLSVTILLTGLFAYYQGKELGNLSSHYIYPVHLAADAVSIDCSLSNTPERISLYRAKAGSKADADQLAAEIFAQLDAEVLPDRTIYYDYTAVYYAQNGDMTLWVDYTGLTWTLYEYVIYDATGQIEPAESEARQFLEQQGIHLPAGAVYAQQDDSFSFTAAMLEEAENVYNGSVVCRLADSGQYSAIENKMTLCEQVREIDIISASEAAGKLAKGQFRWYGGKKIGHIAITGAKLGWEMDSKGYYQPIWNFYTLIDGQEYTLLIPALTQ